MYLECNSLRPTLNGHSIDVHGQELSLNHVINFTVDNQGTGITKSVAINC